MKTCKTPWILTSFLAGAFYWASIVPSAGDNAVPEPGSTFRDCQACPEMAVLPPGSFMMGSKDGRFDERPVHRVSIDQPFAVGKYEVTWEQWEACVAEGACNNEPVMKAGGDNGWGKGRRPVVEVSWRDARTYIAWLNSKVQGKPYRLLSEAEWEYAARAGTTTAYHWGEEYDSSKANNANETVPVGQYPANAFGLYDMHGNALEWVQDCYKDSYEGAPADGTPVSGPADCERVLRSGSWSYGPRVLRAADRYAVPPGDRINILSFRVAKSL